MSEMEGNRKVSRKEEEVSVPVQMNVKKGIEDLPKEVLFEILSYLSVRDVINNVQKVCKKWEELADESHLWSKLILYCEPGNTFHDIENILQQAPRLQKFMCQFKISSSVLDTLINSCRDIRKIEMSYEQNITETQLDDMYDNCKNLEELNVPNVIIEDEEKMDLLAQFPNIRKLSFAQSYPRHIKFKALAEGCPNLQEIEILTNQYDANDLDYFFQCKGADLLSLVIGCRSIQGVCILPLLSECAELKSLTLHSSCSRNATEIGCIKNLTKLTSFTWTHVGLVDISDFTDLFTDANLSQLTKLDLSYLRHYDDALANLIVVNCPNLTALHLKACKNLSDESVKNFCTLRDLQCVDLYRSAITDRGIGHLIKCSNLTYLGLGYCPKITRRGYYLVMELKWLRTLIVDACDLRIVPLLMIPRKLKFLRLFTMHGCTNSDEDLVKLKDDMPLLKLVPEFSFVILD